MAFVTPLIKPHYELYSPPTSPGFRRQSLAPSFFYRKPSLPAHPAPKRRSSSAPNIKVCLEGETNRHRSILRCNTISTERAADEPGKKVHFAMFAEQFTFDKKKPPLSPKDSFQESPEPSPRAKRLSPRSKAAMFYKLFSNREVNEAKAALKQTLVESAVTNAVGPLRLAEGVVSCD